jgi:alpha-L-fucosidase
MTDRTKWFEEARFGMFIHWGAYSVPARGEWVKSKEEITTEEYQKYVDAFDPSDCDPREWAALAKKAGMRYAVMTAKHHDGFCMFDSKLTDYKSKRDFIKEYIEAFRSEGLKVGLYYSLLDWHHEDYPSYGDPCHPMRNNKAYENKKADFENYIKYFHGQVRELLSNYGRIDVLWFDFSYNEMRAGKWQAAELVRMARQLQPDVIMDNRLELHDKVTADPEYAGDFYSPEQVIPSKGMKDKNGDAVPWESCITLNDNWGYASEDKNYKTPETVIKALVNCVSKSGNLLLNVGPDAKGRIPDEAVKILTEVGKWMDDNKESIYKCKGSAYGKPEWGRYTQNGSMLYAHIFDRGIGPVNIPYITKKIISADMLYDRSSANITTPWNAMMDEGNVFVSFRSAGLPYPYDTVVRLELD